MDFSFKNSFTKKLKNEYSTTKNTIHENLQNKYTTTKYVIFLFAFFSEFILLIKFLDVSAIQINVFIFKKWVVLVGATINPKEVFQFDGILKMIIGSLATLLAIVFALSQFILTNIIDKYSVQTIKTYEESPQTKLFLVYILIIVYTFLILIFPNLSTLSSLGYVILVILSIYFFIISFAYLINYIDFMFELINPLKFVDVLKNNVIKAIIKGDEESIQNSIRSIADTCIKLVMRGEETVSIKYSDYLKDIFFDFKKLRKEEPEKFQIVSYEPHELKEEDYNVLKYILNEYLRVYEVAIGQKQSNISKHMSKNLYEILTGVLYEE